MSWPGSNPGAPIGRIPLFKRDPACIRPFVVAIWSRLCLCAGALGASLLGLNVGDLEVLRVLVLRSADEFLRTAPVESRDEERGRGLFEVTGAARFEPAALPCLKLDRALNLVSGPAAARGQESPAYANSRADATTAPRFMSRCGDVPLVGMGSSSSFSYDRDQPLRNTQRWVRRATR